MAESNEMEAGDLLEPQEASQITAIKKPKFAMEEVGGVLKLNSSSPSFEKEKSKLDTKLFEFPEQSLLEENVGKEISGPYADLGKSFIKKHALQVRPASRSKIDTEATSNKDEKESILGHSCLPLDPVQAMRLLKTTAEDSVSKLTSNNLLSDPYSSLGTQIDANAKRETTAKLQLCRMETDTENIHSPSVPDLVSITNASQTNVENKNFQSNSRVSPSGLNTAIVNPELLSNHIASSSGDIDQNKFVPNVGQKLIVTTHKGNSSPNSSILLSVVNQSKTIDSENGNLQTPAKLLNKNIDNKGVKPCNSTTIKEPLLDPYLLLGTEVGTSDKRSQHEKYIKTVSERKVKGHQDKQRTTRKPRTKDSNNSAKHLESPSPTNITNGYVSDSSLLNSLYTAPSAKSDELIRFEKSNDNQIDHAIEKSERNDMKQFALYNDNGSVLPLKEQVDPYQDLGGVVM